MLLNFFLYNFSANVRLTFLCCNVPLPLCLAVLRMTSTGHISASARVGGGGPQGQRKEAHILSLFHLEPVFTVCCHLHLCRDGALGSNDIQQTQQLTGYASFPTFITNPITVPQRHQYQMTSALSSETQCSFKDQRQQKQVIPQPWISELHLKLPPCVSLQASGLQRFLSSIPQVATVFPGASCVAMQGLPLGFQFL